MKKRLVIITSAQFGYHIDTYYYCKYLREKYELVFIGWDHGLKPVLLDNIEVFNVNRNGGISRVLRLLRTINREKKDNDTLLFIKYFRFVSLVIRIVFFKNPMVLDIRTGSIVKNKYKRFIENKLLIFVTIFFKNITVISTSLKKKLSLHERCKILPLGADVISNKKKVLDGLKLLYVGTLYNRNIDILIDGIKLYYSNTNECVEIHLTIIGEGLSGEREKLQKQVSDYGLNDIVTFTGQIPHEKLKKYFEVNTIGVSYIPLTEYYDAQPPTKTFEYLMSGLPVLATKTSENLLIINSNNGVLIGDSADDVCEGIIKIKNQLKTYSMISIQEQSTCYSWEKIVKKLEIYLEAI